MFVGRIQRLKGIDILIRAAAELRDDIGGLRVLMAGGTATTPGASHPKRRASFSGSACWWTS